MDSHVQQPTRILAIRHGETDWNVERRIQGQTDIPLNDLGRRQAARLEGAVAREGLSAVYSSDLQRAWETARAVARGAPAAGPLRVDVGLRERAFGVFEGCTYSEIEQRWPEAAARWGRREPDFCAAGGETLQAFYDRCVRTAERLAEAHAGQTIALVAHGGVLDCLYRAATRTDIQAPRTWRVDNAAIHRLTHETEGLVLLAWGDGAHLDGLKTARDDTDSAVPDRLAPGA